MFQKFLCVVLVVAKVEESRLQYIRPTPDAIINIKNPGSRVARTKKRRNCYSGVEYQFLPHLLANTETLMILCDHYVVNNLNPFIASLLAAWSPSLRNLHIVGDLNQEEALKVWQAIVSKATLRQLAWTFYDDRESIIPPDLPAMLNLQQLFVRRYIGNLVPLFRLIGPNTREVRL